MRFRLYIVLFLLFGVSALRAQPTGEAHIVNGTIVNLAGGGSDLATNWLTIQLAGGSGGHVTWTLPNSNGTNGDFFSNNGSGTITWSHNGSTLTSLNASNLASGTVPSGVVSGSYTGITGVGTLTVGTWNAGIIPIAYGGTDTSALGSHGALIGEGSNGINTTGFGTGPNGGAAGMSLISNGTALDASMQIRSFEGTFAADTIRIQNTSGSVVSYAATITNAAINRTTPVFVTVQKDGNTSTNAQNYILQLDSTGSGRAVGSVSVVLWRASNVNVANNDGVSADYVIPTSFAYAGGYSAQAVIQNSGGSASYFDTTISDSHINANSLVFLTCEKDNISASNTRYIANVINQGAGTLKVRIQRGTSVNLSTDGCRLNYGTFSTSPDARIVCGQVAVHNLLSKDTILLMDTVTDVHVNASSTILVSVVQDADSASGTTYIANVEKIANWPAGKFIISLTARNAASIPHTGTQGATVNYAIINNASGALTTPDTVRFSAAPVAVMSTANQLRLGGGPAGNGTTTTISAVAPASSATYTIPDVGTTGKFAMSVNGLKLPDTTGATASGVLTLGTGGGGLTWSAGGGGGGSGTVTSVSGSGGSTGLTLTGGPITTSGTLTLGGTLAVANGGTNITSYTADDMLYASGSTTLSKLAIGSANQVLTVSGGAPSWQAPANGGEAIFGDASDGAVTFDGTSTVLGLAPSSSTYTLTREIFLGAGTSIVSAGVTIKTGGYRIYSTGTLIDSGTIDNSGGNASGTTGGAASSPDNSTGNTERSGAGGGSQGGAGRTTVGAGNAGIGYTSSPQRVTCGGLGGAGGAGASNGGGSAASSNVFSVGINTGNSIHSFPFLLGANHLGTTISSNTVAIPSGGSSGGGGGLANLTGGSTSGAGGGSGGNVVIVAHDLRVLSSGTITAKGGNGSSAAANGGTADAGGGGGGGGGYIVLVYDAFTGNTPTAAGNCTGGTHGSKLNTGGGSAADGSDGSNGNVFLFSNSGGNSGAYTAGSGLSLSGGQFSYAPTIVTANPSDPTATSSGTVVMMGLNQTITATASGKIRFFISGNINSGATGTPTVQIYYGTGTPPTNGAAVTGTAIGSLAKLGGLANGTDFVTLEGTATGLISGTSYWWDIGMACTGVAASSSFSGVHMEAETK